MLLLRNGIFCFLFLHVWTNGSVHFSCIWLDSSSVYLLNSKSWLWTRRLHNGFWHSSELIMIESCFWVNAAFNKMKWNQWLLRRIEETIRINLQYFSNDVNSRKTSNMLYTVWVWDHFHRMAFDIVMDRHSTSVPKWRSRRAVEVVQDLTIILCTSLGPGRSFLNVQKCS